MDAFDAVRQAAVLLHSSAVALGADPLSPVEVVKKAAESLDIEVQELPPDSSSLSGALAVFDVQLRLICCSDNGSDVERALLVAHELGHAKLHADESRCEDHDIDASASTEQAPVGLERVTDYGARERRELQSNVFARELVLPMNLASRLFLKDRMTASAIAERTGLSQRLVRQQVLDAVLLPIPAALPETPHVEHPIDKSQEVAAHHQGSAFNLQAGPGTGKTRTLVERVRWLVDQGVDPASILVLTFSNRAAGELSERFAAAIPEAATRIWTGTFHAFGLDLTRRYHDRLGRSSDPRLFDRSDAIAALEDVLPTLPLDHFRNLWRPAYSLREILGGISRAKDELADCVRYRDLASAMLASAGNDDERKAAAKCLEIADVYERYEAVLREEDAFDFGDLIMRPALLLESDPALRAQLSERHRHILVDEFQDVNRASSRLLRAISGDGQRLWVVGDARQSIYRFRGASPANLQSFEREFAGKAGRLAINYRSTEQLVSALCAVAMNLKASEHQLPLELEANRGTGPATPEIRSFVDPNAEAAGVATSVLELQSQGVPLHEQVVLCRSNAKLVAIANALEAQGVPVLHLGSFFERNDVRDLLALLSLSVDKYAAGLVRVGSWPRYGLSLQDVYVATKWLREDDQKPLERFAACALEATSLSERGAAGLKLLAADLDGLSQSQMPWEFLCVYLLDRTDFVRDIVKDKSVSGKMTAVAIWQFMNFVQAPTFGGTGSPARRVLDRVRELVLLAEERGLREVPDSALHLDAVRLMTIHASKGLEFEAVHLFGMTAGAFPTHPRAERCPPPSGMIEGSGNLSVAEQAKLDQISEEQCLFFVALSRAKTYARLYRPESSAGGGKTKASEFLGWLTAIGVPEISPKLAEKTAAPVPRVFRVVREEAHIPEVGQLAQYENCPQRYFYTHILKLGTARRQTAFTRTHACIQELLSWYTTAGNAASAEEVQRMLQQLWETHGPTDHAFAAEYRALAASIVERLLRIAPAGIVVDLAPIKLTFPTGSITVKPDQVSRQVDGRMIIRRLNTGKKRSHEYYHLEYTAYRLAAERMEAALEAVFLTTGEHETVNLGNAKFKNQQEAITTLLDRLHRGEFPAEPDAVVCPNCPHFFVCDAVPKGFLKID